MRATCPLCHKDFEVVSLTMYLWYHVCEIADTSWFSNGLVYSNQSDKIRGELRCKKLTR